MDLFSLKSDFFKKLFAEKREPLRSFHAVRAEEQATDSIERGTLLVPIDTIVGTVGRYNDFDCCFRTRRQGDNPRLEGIIRAMEAGKDMLNKGANALGGLFR